MVYPYEKSSKATDALRGVRAKTETGQANETLLKFLAHNVVVVGQTMHEMELGSLNLGKN